MSSVPTPPTGRFRHLLFAACGLFLLLGCSKPSEVTPDVIVIQSGRIRGNVYPSDLQSIAPLQHYPHIAGYVKKVREEARKTGAKVVVVDLGDSLSGSFASHATNSENMVRFFNEVGYDFIVLGNLDNNILPAQLAGLKAKILCPFAAPDGQPATEGTAFAARSDIGGLPVEMIANFYGEVDREQHPERFPTWFGNTNDDVTPVRDYARVIASLGERPRDALSLMTWMKFESPKNPPAAFLADLARQGVDAILAHRIYSGRERDAWSEKTFYDWKPPVSENILRDNGGFTLARLDLKRDGDQWTVLRQELLPMTANTAPSDERILATISELKDRIAEADKPVDTLEDPISEDEILLGYLTALSGVPGTDIAAYSRQSIRSDWPAGELTASRVFNSLPWTTPLVQIALTPAQLEQLGRVNGMVFLRKSGLPNDRPLTVTTSRFFASLLAQELDLPADAIRPAGTTSEFDFFLEHLTNAPKPLGFGTPDGWILENPRA